MITVVPKVDKTWNVISVEGATFKSDALPQTRDFSSFGVLYNDISLWFNCLAGTILKWVSYDAPTEFGKRDAFYEYARGVNKLMEGMQEKASQQGTTSITQKPSFRAWPTLGPMEYWVNPVVTIHPRTGQSYEVKRASTVRAKFNPSTIRLDFSNE